MRCARGCAPTAFSDTCRCQTRFSRHFSCTAQKFPIKTEKHTSRLHPTKCDTAYYIVRRIKNQGVAQQNLTKTGGMVFRSCFVQKHARRQQDGGCRENGNLLPPCAEKRGDPRISLMTIYYTTTNICCQLFIIVVQDGRILLTYKYGKGIEFHIRLRRSLPWSIG